MRERQRKKAEDGRKKRSDGNVVAGGDKSWNGWSDEGGQKEEIETEDGTSKVMKIYGGLRQCKRK